jgi:hypothetical protein
LRGKGQRLTWAHGLIEEVVVHTDGLQTSSPEAQELERHVRHIWKVFDSHPAAHRGSHRLGNRLDELGKQLATLDVPYQEWQVIYRQLLQLGHALRGEPQLLEKMSEPAERRVS